MWPDRAAYLVALDRLLPKVEKSTRYLGGEWNSAIKDPAEIDCEVVHAFPNIYEIGTSHLGVLVVYSRLNKLDSVVAERFPADMREAEEVGVPGVAMCYAASVNVNDCCSLQLFAATYLSAWLDGRAGAPSGNDRSAIPALADIDYSRWETNNMRIDLNEPPKLASSILNARLATVAILLMLCAACLGVPGLSKAVAVADRYYAALKAGDDEALFAQYSPEFLAATAREDWGVNAPLRKGHGALRHYRLVVSHSTRGSGGPQNGDWIELKYDVSYANVETTETLTLFSPVHDGEPRIRKHTISRRRAEQPKSN